MKNVTLRIVGSKTVNIKAESEEAACCDARIKFLTGPDTVTVKNLYVDDVEVVDVGVVDTKRK